MSAPAVKSASTLGQSAGVGAGSGVAAGALVTLFSENPSLRELFKNTLVGGAGGAVIGAGAHALSGGATPPPEPAAAPSKAPSPPTPAPPHKMSLGIAALSGAVPFGVGSAIHGGISQGPAQAAGSGAAALAPGVLVTLLQQMRGKPPGTKGTQAASMIGSMLASMGAAHAGNKLREN